MKYNIIAMILIILFIASCKSSDTSNSNSQGNDHDKTVQTPEEEWNSWLRIHQDILEYEVLSVASSETWIEKHRDEIHIPDQIEFGKPHRVMELHLMTYQIKIAVDHNGNRRVAAWEWPPEKILVKIGDKLPFSFSTDIGFEWKGNFDSISELQKSYQEYLNNKTYEFVLEAKKRYLRSNIGNSIIAYMSPEGATVHYNTDRIITQIDGKVFKRDIP